VSPEANSGLGVRRWLGSISGVKVHHRGDDDWGLSPVGAEARIAHVLRLRQQQSGGEQAPRQQRGLWAHQAAPARAHEHGGISAAETSAALQQQPDCHCHKSASADAGTTCGGLTVGSRMT
jgi:hypothetical protein